ncbi:unnamed protein product, partial [Prorocentrum cordatum]
RWSRCGTGLPRSCWARRSTACPWTSGERRLRDGRDGHQHPPVRGRLGDPHALQDLPEAGDTHRGGVARDSLLEGLQDHIPEVEVQGLGQHPEHEGPGRRGRHRPPREAHGLRPEGADFGADGEGPRVFPRRRGPAGGGGGRPGRAAAAAVRGVVARPRGEGGAFPPPPAPMIMRAARKRLSLR